MKNLSLYILALLACLFTACEDDEDKYVIYTETSEIVAVPTENTYDVAIRASQKWNATVYSGKDWITLEKADGETGDGTVTFKVAANNSKNDRTGLIAIESGTTTQTIAVTQKSASTVKMEYLATCDYYGNKFSNGAGYAEIELRGGNLDIYGKPAGEAYIVKLAIFTEMAADPNRAQLKPGTYTLAAKADGKPGTFFTDDNASYFVSYDEHRNITHPTLAEGSTINITSTSENNYTVVGEFFTEDGDKIEWYYEGNIQLLNPLKINTDKDGYRIIRSEDVLEAAFEGDIDGYGSGKVKIMLNDDSGDGYYVDFYANNPIIIGDNMTNYSLPTGEYYVSENVGKALTIIPGTVKSDAKIQPGSLLYNIVGSMYSIRGIVTGGKMTVAKYGDDEYDIKFDFTGVDNTGANVEMPKMRFIGKLNFADKRPQVIELNQPVIIASYVIADRENKVACYRLNFGLTEDDAKLAKNKTSNLQLWLFSDAPVDENGNIIEPDPSKDVEAQLAEGEYTLAEKENLNKKFTLEAPYSPGLSMKGSGYNVFDSYRYNYHMDRGTVTVEKTGNGNYQIKTNDFSAICSQNAQRVFVNLNWTGKL